MVFPVSVEKGLVSCFTLLIDRFEISSNTINRNFNNCGTMTPMEWLVADNGSKDPRIEMWVKTNPLLTYFRQNKINEGVGRAMNQLFLRSRGEYICFMTNDIAMPDGWLKKSLDWINKVPKCGIIGSNWYHSLTPPISEKFGLNAHWTNEKMNRVFGYWFFKREIIEDIGFFHEGYGPYGIEDSDFNERVNLAGYNSLYLPNFDSQHLVNDYGEQTEYRKMKDKSLQDNCAIFNERVKNFHTPEGIREPLPPMRDPL